LLQGNSDNPIVKNIDRVNATFPASIDTLETPLPLKFSTLLTTSKYSRFQYAPVRLSFDIIRIEQKPSAYNKSYVPAAILVEGRFESLYKNRVSKEMDATLKQIDATFKDTSPPTAQIFVGDGDIIKNLYDSQTNRISPIGFNKWEGIAYEGNRDFISNAIDYLLDDYGLIESRTKNIKMRLLNQVKLQKERLKWQLINILGPILFVLIFGLSFHHLRKRRYTS
jgi:ABC-2 type transport system permease protein